MLRVSLLGGLAAGGCGAAWTRWVWLRFAYQMQLCLYSTCYLHGSPSGDAHYLRCTEECVVISALKSGFCGVLVLLVW